MENKSHALMAGLFTLLLGIALVAAALWLGRDTQVRREYELVTSGSVSGLAPQSDVRYRGLEVGKVEALSFDPKVPGQILIKIGVDPGTPVTGSTFAQLGYQGVTGLGYIQLDDDGKGGSQLLAENSGQRIPLRPGLLDKLSNGGEAIVADLQVTITRLNELLGPANQKQLSETLVGLNQAAQKITEVAGQVTPTLQRLPGTVDSAHTTLVSIGSTANDYSALAKRLQAEDGLVAKLNESLDQFDTTARAIRLETLPNVGALSTDAARTSRSLSHAVDRLDERPQSLIFGAATGTPGPGEPGFVVPGAK
jgi:phospholipid/cholesterol/gamma-HCH transport system substrate-binding protein